MPVPHEIRVNFLKGTYSRMANTKSLSKDERKTKKRAARKTAKTAKPKAKRTHPRGEKKRKVKKLARGTSKR